jgi:hypothetical protein
MHRLHLAWASVVGAIFITGLSVRQTQAADAPGLYVGAAFGRAEVTATSLPDPFTGTPTFGDFKENHSAYKVALGVRPTSLVGAELAYFDLGHPRAIVGAIATPIASLPPNAVSGDVAMKGSAAFGVLYLPVPILDVYVKGGVARIESTTTTACSPSGARRRIPASPPARESSTSSAPGQCGQSTNVFMQTAQTQAYCRSVYLGRSSSPPGQFAPSAFVASEHRGGAGMLALRDGRLRLMALIRDSLSAAWR